MSGNVSLKIRELRMNLGMSQTELAELAGLSKATVCNLESGRIRRIELETVGKLCKALSCTPSDLFALPALSERELAKRQWFALSKLIGSISYDKPFDPDELDSDLAAITNQKLHGALLVSEGSSKRTQRKGRKT